MTDQASRFAIAVVIPVFNMRETIGQQLDAVLGQQCAVPFQVLVADSGSTDGTVELVKDRSRADERLFFVDASQKPRSESGPRNLGVREAQAPLIASCDADDLVAPGWLQALYEGLKECRIVDATREYWELNPGLPRTIFPETRAGVNFYGRPTVCGGAFAAYKDDYLAAGGFPEDFLGGVDTEFGLRLWRVGGHCTPGSSGGRCALSRAHCARHKVSALSGPRSLSAANHKAASSPVVHFDQHATATEGKVVRLGGIPNPLSLRPESQIAMGSVSWEIDR